MSTVLSTRVTLVGCFEQLGNLPRSSSDLERKRERVQRASGVQFMTFKKPWAPVGQWLEHCILNLSAESRGVDSIPPRSWSLYVSYCIVKISCDYRKYGDVLCYFVDDS